MDSYFWSFSLQEEEKGPLRLPGEAAAAVFSRPGRPGAAAPGGGKTTLKTHFLGRDHLVRVLTAPERLVQNKPFSLYLFFIFAGEPHRWL